MEASVSDVVGKVADGKMDAGLDELYEAVRERRRDERRAKAEKIIGGLNIGDEVALTDEAKPKYLVGETAKVVGTKGRRVIVDLDAGKIRKVDGKGLRVPAAWVTTEIPETEIEEPAEAELPVDEPSAEQSREELLRKTREQLNAVAGEFGVENAEELPNKGAVADAILEARS